MSFGLPAVKPKPELSTNFALNEGNYGVPNVMDSGLTSADSANDFAHPLMQSELNHFKNKDTMNMTVLRNTQGLHAPLRIAMELKAAKKVGRLPFLQSSNVMFESLTGRDIEIDPSDVFNTPEFVEVANMPHAVVEKSIGIL